VLYNLLATRSILISILSEFNELEEDPIVDINPSGKEYSLLGKTEKKGEKGRGTL